MLKMVQNKTAQKIIKIILYTLVSIGLIPIILFYCIILAPTLILFTWVLSDLSFNDLIDFYYKGKWTE